MELLLASIPRIPSAGVIVDLQGFGERVEVREGRCFPGIVASFNRQSHDHDLQVCPGLIDILQLIKGLQCHPKALMACCANPSLCDQLRESFSERASA